MKKKSLRFLCLISVITTFISLTACNTAKNSDILKEPSSNESGELVSAPTYNPVYSESKNNEEKKEPVEKIKKDTSSTTDKPVEKTPIKTESSNEGGTTISNENNSTEKLDYRNLNNTKISWWFKPNKLHVTPEVNTKLDFDLNKYDACYVGDTDRKVLYMTFDEGYENGYTGKILDTLKENDVKAIFFVTLPYLKGNHDLIKRMVDEGHIVANHTNHHPSMPTVTGTEEKFNKELKDVEDEYSKIVGKEMPKFFRPPMGEYSEKSLAMTKNLGYKTVFWSFAYHDWDINKQPDPVKAKKTILDGLHNGSIMLIHAVSKTNTEILGDVIKEAKAQGYEFELLKDN
ncbi:peptidoglycan-N-acetylmuramic acid deacetylase [Clostridium punense]|uniref:Peptidoglycan-N-acetylmuramic acid deacetylase n=1 Tax=Clostridium punense TaxID=1054297 RepID=A0ABS4JZK1_9CLOT|nr:MULTISPECIES: delta-lactam-biosynthetic de-N-acetylase [Clostridium]EQB88123.1 hypothetical protein M918_05685 [Clostridium sp. BL8]MBP2020950.1 peptidoglycan-N-acetylmuramic acid deacetylase [Clostridium punense]